MRADTTQINEDSRNIVFWEGTFARQEYEEGKRINMEMKKVVSIPLDISRRPLLSRRETGVVI